MLRDAGQAGAQAAAVAEKGAICNYAGTCIIRFDRTNPRALRIAREQARNLIVEISASSRKQISGLIMKGLQTGIAPVPLSRVLRNMVTLNSTQQEYVLGLVEEMKAAQAGDLITRFPPRPGVRQIPGFRARVPPGGPSQRWVTKNASRYQRMHHLLRARTIARSEAHFAANGGQVELWNQAVESGQLPPNVKRVWITADDIRVRAAHAGVAGEVVGLEEDFSIGVEPGEETNCRCGQAIAPREGVGVPGTQPAPPTTPAAPTGPAPEFIPGQPMGKKYMEELTEQMHGNATGPLGYQTPDETGVWDRTLHSMQQRRGFNGMPRTESTAFFNKQNEGKVMWRGTDKKFYGDYLNPGVSKFTGAGVYGNGTYHAIGGAEGLHAGERSRLLATHYGGTQYRSLLNKGSKTISHEGARDLIPRFREDFLKPMRIRLDAALEADFTSALSADLQSRFNFLKHLQNDVGRLSTYYGYDGITVGRGLIGGGGPDSYMVILNRSATTVEVLR
jgi:hypothetical protein